MKRFLVAAALLLASLSSTLSVGAQLPAFVPVTDQMLQNPDPGDWLLWRRTLNSWGYSPLDQINKSNVSRLKMVWSRGMGPGIQEATPLVYRGVMYLPHPSDFIEAMNAATGELLWDYKRRGLRRSRKSFARPASTGTSQSTATPSLTRAATTSSSR